MWMTASVFLRSVRLAWLEEQRLTGLHLLGWSGRADHRLRPAVVESSSGAGEGLVAEQSDHEAVWCLDGGVAFEVAVEGNRPEI